MAEMWQIEVWVDYVGFLGRVTRWEIYCEKGMPKYFRELEAAEKTLRSLTEEGQKARLSYLRDPNTP